MKSSSLAIFLMLYLMDNGFCDWGTTQGFNLRTRFPSLNYGEETGPTYSTLDTTTPTTTTPTTTSTTTTTTTNNNNNSSSSNNNNNSSSSNNNNTNIINN